MTSLSLISGNTYLNVTLVGQRKHVFDATSVKWSAFVAMGMFKLSEFNFYLECKLCFP